MEKLEPLENLIKNVLYSGYLIERKPLSLLIIAPPESGKSEVIRKFSDNVGVKEVNQATRYGFASIVKQNYENVKLGHTPKLQHLLIPDMIAVLNGAQATVAENINFLSQLIEEGVREIRTYYLTFEPPAPIKAGVVAAITKEDFLAKRKGLNKLGFLTRFIPFSYTYENEVRDKIFAYIRQGKDIHEAKIKLDFPTEPVPVHLNEEHLQLFEPYAKDPKLQSYGFRLYADFRALLEASALSHGRTETTVEDVAELQESIDYINLKFNPMV